MGSYDAEDTEEVEEEEAEEEEEISVISPPRSPVGFVLYRVGCHVSGSADTITTKRTTEKATCVILDDIGWFVGRGGCGARARAAFGVF